MKLTHKILSSSVMAFGVLGMLALTPAAQAHDSYEVLKKTFVHTPHGKKVIKQEIVHKPITRKHIHKKVHKKQVVSKHHAVKHNDHEVHNDHHDTVLVQVRHGRNFHRGGSKFKNRHGYSRRGFRNHHRSRGSRVGVTVHPSFVFKF